MIKKTLRCLLSLFLLAGDKLINQAKEKKPRLALIRLDAIGDFIIWLDSAKEYRSLFPSKKITLIANSAWAELAHGLPFFDEVWPIDLCRFTRNPLYRWKILRKISQAGFEVAIQPTFSRVLLHGDSVIRATGALQRIGSVGDLSNISAKQKAIADRWYTHLQSGTSELLMELERNAEFICNLSGKTFNSSLPKLQLSTTLMDRLQPQSEYFIVFPGASWHGKQWPAEYFAQVLEQVHQCYGWQAVLCGSADEHELCQNVTEQSRGTAVNLAGRTSLQELAGLICGARLLIGNDSSAVHIATAVGTPAVCILGGGHYGRFMPYPDTVEGIKPLVAAHEMPCFNCNWRCNQPHAPTGPVPCISSVPVERVLNLAIQAIEQTSRIDRRVSHAVRSE